MDDDLSIAPVDSIVPALERISILSAPETVQEPLLVHGLKGTARALFVAHSLKRTPRPTVCILPTDKEAETFSEDLKFFLPRDNSLTARYYPAWGVSINDGLSPKNDIVAAQIECLYDLLSVVSPILVTSAEALLQRLMPQSEFMTATLSLAPGHVFPLSELIDYFVQWGYRRVPLVEEKGEIGVRGGIIDFFPPLADCPIRIEYEGDEIDSVRLFDSASQRSTNPLEEATILPMRFFPTSRLQASLRTVEEDLDRHEAPHREHLRITENIKSGLPFPGVEFFLPYVYPDLDSFDAYLPKNTLVWAFDPPRQFQICEEFLANVTSPSTGNRGEERFTLAHEDYYLSPGHALEWRTAFATVEVRSLDTVHAPYNVTTKLHTSFKRSEKNLDKEKSLKPLVEAMHRWRDEGRHVFLTASTHRQATHLQQLLEGHATHVPISDEAREFDLPKVSAKPSTCILIGQLSRGFVLPTDSLVFLSEEEIFGERRRRRQSRPNPVTDYLTGLSQLKTGDYVVHTDHGIAKYQGLQHLNVAQTTGDYLHLEYLAGDKLFLPVDRINLVQKYSGADDRPPSLDRLGSQVWERVKKKTRESIQAMARELLEIHALRQSTERSSIIGYSGDYEEFVSLFPFEETTGQRAAIEDVLNDLESRKPMDRLVCGDVGYGKTEVALRAAYLTVESGKQVAVLVPTTVLAQQHAETFKRRFSETPVHIELLNRFRSAAETKSVVHGLKTGSVDIVVGTQRLLQRDVKFKDLGLVVIDEEHRFGVTHKEKVKRFRHEVDVLTLSATPIPRSLNMGMMGLRDLSVIETPPVDRQAIRTYVAQYDRQLVRSAILQELSRGGQTFFVHNRVETIGKIADDLRQLIPEATLNIAHGQMGERELERVMLDFMHHRINVLVCSAIIESGLDIPTANTIIINRADRFGLAQLYQLRGRVGRSAMRAYAYLLIPGEHKLTKDAQRRLEVLQELDDLGGGFRLAAHDLEIRGAGNLLGKEQSGRVAAVGYELYAQMLDETVRELRGGEIEISIEPEIQLGTPAYLPEAYIPDVNQRLVFYKKLANVKERADLDALAFELEDRFGTLPEVVSRFIEVMDLRRVLRYYLVRAVYHKNEKVTLHFHENSRIQSERLVSFVQNSKSDAQIRPGLSLSFSITTKENVMDTVKSLLRSFDESC